eukprot:2015231-Prymnesium_polylepis.1
MRPPGRRRPDGHGGGHGRCQGGDGCQPSPFEHCHALLRRRRIVRRVRVRLVLRPPLAGRAQGAEALGHARLLAGPGLQAAARPGAQQEAAGEVGRRDRPRDPVERCCAHAARREAAALRVALSGAHRRAPSAFPCSPLACLLPPPLRIPFPDMPVPVLPHPALQEYDQKANGDQFDKFLSTLNGKAKEGTMTLTALFVLLEEATRIYVAAVGKYGESRFYRFGPKVINCLADVRINMPHDAMSELRYRYDASIDGPIKCAVDSDIEAAATVMQLSVEMMDDVARGLNRKPLSEHSPVKKTPPAGPGGGPNASPSPPFGIGMPAGSSGAAGIDWLRKVLAITTFISVPSEFAGADKTKAVKQAYVDLDAAD